MKISKIAIYARVSDDKKKSDGERRQDVMRQVDLLKEFLAKGGLTAQKIYIDDGKSAFTEDLNSRPAFRELMRDAKARWIDVVYIESLDRFSRKLGMGLVWLEQLSRHGCTVTSIHEGELDVTINVDWMRSAIALMFAEWYSRELSEKVKSGMARAKGKDAIGKRGIDKKKRKKRANSDKGAGK